MLFTRKKLSEEELKAKAEKEQEWARRWAEKGERWGQKAGVRKTMGKLDYWLNTYPKTFFISVAALMAICYALNLMVPGISGWITNTAVNLENAASTTARPSEDTKQLHEALSGTVQEYRNTLQELQALLEKEEKTFEDTLSIITLGEKVESLKMILDGRERDEELVEKDGEKERYGEIPLIGETSDMTETK